MSLVLANIHDIDPRKVTFQPIQNGSRSFVSLSLGDPVRVFVNRDNTATLAAIEAACREAREWLEAQPAPDAIEQEQGVF